MDRKIEDLPVGTRIVLANYGAPVIGIKTGDIDWHAEGKDRIADYVIIREDDGSHWGWYREGCSCLEAELPQDVL